MLVVMLVIFPILPFVIREDITMSPGGFYRQRRAQPRSAEFIPIRSISGYSLVPSGRHMQHLDLVFAAKIRGIDIRGLVATPDPETARRAAKLLSTNGVAQIQE